MTDQPPRVIEVVFLRRNIPRPFYYRYGAEADPLGSPVVVPLNNQLTVGVAVDTVDPGEVDVELSQLKQVVGTARTVRSLPRDLVELGRWLSDYYLSAHHKAFSSILPPSYLPRPETAWELDEPELLDELPADVSSTFEPGGETGLEELKEETERAESELLNYLSPLEDRPGFERTVRLRRPPSSRQKYNYVKLTGESDEVNEFIDSAARRQRELLEHLAQQGDSFQADLPEPLRRTDLLRRLEGEDLISREQRYRYRLPLEDVRTEPGAGEAFELTDEQRQVYESVLASKEADEFQPHLLHGVTGSGKTEVYFRLVESTLERGETALVLVPEITLAVFLFRRFRDRFGEQLATLHSGLSKGERRDEWHRIQQGEARVVLGVQSAVFAPLEDLGLIVVDEEHDSSYKAGSTPRYHSRDVAVKRAQILDVPVLLGSATPSVESYSNSMKSRYSLHEMKQRPTGGQLPEVKISDLRGADSLFTNTLVEETREALESGRRAIWFLNRRGYSNFVLCGACGETVQCPDCNVSLTYHAGPGRLRCHYCGYARGMPGACEHCGESELARQGTGTQQLTRAAGKLYPDARIIRMDADTVSRKNKRFELLEDFESSSGALLVGTQMVTKGLDFEHLEFVGVINVDTGLNFPDFRAGEKTFQQLVQVCGRAGRDKPGATVLIQTYNPRHYAVQLGARRDYGAFIRQELNQRQPLSYPPFARLIDFVATGPGQSDVREVLTRLADQLPGGETYEQLGPVACGLEQIKGRYRWHLLLRGQFPPAWRRETRGLLCEEFKLPDEVRLIPNVDPADVL